LTELRDDTTETRLAWAGHGQNDGLTWLDDARETRQIGRTIRSLDDPRAAEAGA
jgi:hypothetical protein